MRSAGSEGRFAAGSSFAFGSLRSRPTTLGQVRSEVQPNPWQPMRGGRSGPIIVPVQVNGVPLQAMIDSGATRTAVSRGVADRLRLKSQGRISLAGLTGDLDCERTRPISIGIGATRLPPTAAIVLDLDAITAAARVPFDVILGQDVFLLHEIEFDFENGRFRLNAPRRSDDAPDDQVTLQRTGEGLFCVPVAAGDVTAAAAIDLGSMVPLYVDHAFAVRHGLADPERTSTAMTLGAEGRALHTVGRLPQLSVAGTVFTDMPFAIPDRWNLEVPIVLGLPLLSRFNLRLAFRELWARLDPKTVDVPFARDRSGINVVGAVDRLSIVHVAPRSPAEQVGLAVGDAIISVDGEPVDASYFASHKGLGSAPAGTEYALGLADGRNLVLRLADYY